MKFFLGVLTGIATGLALAQLFGKPATAQIDVPGSTLPTQVGLGPGGQVPLPGGMSLNQLLQVIP